jgi:hypothetical protein
LDSEEEYWSGLLLSDLKLEKSGLTKEQAKEVLLNVFRQERRKGERFNRRVREIRIDYVQHAVCALMTYEMLLHMGINFVKMSGERRMGINSVKGDE